MTTKEYKPLEHSIVQALLKPDATHRYDVSDFVEALIVALHSELERCYWNWHQEQLKNREDWQLVGLPGGFEYRKYYWNDCDCGAESPVHTKSCTYVTEHSAWVSRRLATCSDEPELAEDGFLLDSFVNFDKFDAWDRENLHPVCDCGAEHEWSPRGEHLLTCSPSLPNLKFGEVVVNWYKHLGRGMSTNVNWSELRWRAWFDAAMAAIRLYDICGQLEHQKFRDEDAGRKPFSIDERVQCRDCKYCVQFGANTLIWNRQGSRDVADAAVGEADEDDLVV